MIYEYLTTGDDGKRATLRQQYDRLAEELGRRIVTNVVMLGYFAAVTGLVSREAMSSAIESSIKAKAVPLNLKAFEMGYSYQDERSPSVAPA